MSNTKLTGAITDAAEPTVTYKDRTLTLDPTSTEANPRWKTDSREGHPVQLLAEKNDRDVYTVVVQAVGLRGVPGVGASLDEAADAALDAAVARAQALIVTLQSQRGR